jgi:hypothetical protein
MRERLRPLEPGRVTDGHDARYLRGVEELPGALAAAAVPEFIPLFNQKFICRGLHCEVAVMWIFLFLSR